ncbi:hypothetical protein SCHIN_v1c07580 [Spiroplasma chinense]|uniref:Uncharacterized protein n=1 Tax=Spiroplasma chinense TaxID=216932 RepID=A0A5B9Y585_9MOLU|nr:hypothetical protein [Spiroplasma chinense]QEH61953.1 hypothetical protein SCHIN_v1c07580 [Spiroplasma chinense]
MKLIKEIDKELSFDLKINGDKNDFGIEELQPRIILNLDKQNQSFEISNNIYSSKMTNFIFEKWPKQGSLVVKYLYFRYFLALKEIIENQNTIFDDMDVIEKEFIIYRLRNYKKQCELLL